MAVLDGTVLVETDLSHADLSRAFLAGTQVAGARLSGAILERTYRRVRGPSRAHGLEAIVHHGHSCLDLVTLRAGLDMLPESFLQGVGVEREESRPAWQR